MANEMLQTGRNKRFIIHSGAEAGFVPRGVPAIMSYLKFTCGKIKKGGTDSQWQQ